MSSRQKRNFFKTLSFRLTVVYSLLFTLSTAVAFLAIYSLTAKTLQDNTDHDLLEDITEFRALLAEEGMAGLQEELGKEVQSDGVENLLFRIFDRQGKLLLATDGSGWGNLTPTERLAQDLMREGGPLIFDIPVPGRTARARSVVAEVSDAWFLQVAEATDENAEYLEIFTGIFTKAMLAIIGVAALTGWFLARGAMAGVEQVTQTAMQISKGEFKQRVPLKSHGHEIERLASAFNYMLDRIQALLNGIREVTDNIAHDLRGPLTSLRGNAEMALTGGETIEDYRAMASNTVSECDRLLAMVNAMLDISEAEAGASKLDLGPVNLGEVVRQACELYLPLADEKELTLSCQAPVNCQVQGDLRKLQRLISNLLDNALKYTPEGGSVNIAIINREQELDIVVEDNGIGIDQGDLPHIFQRFFRCDHSRSQEGSGLGLSLALAIVKAHGGYMNVISALNEGSRFTVTLPVTAESSASG